MPLRSYFETKKDPQSGSKKCPADKEDMVRALIQKECLESLQCTYTNADLAVNKLATEEVKFDDDIFGQIDDLTAGQKQLRVKEKPMVVLDA